MLILILAPLYFLFVSFLSFYIPGDTLVSKLGLKPLIRITSALSLGISLWALQGLFFGFLNVRFLTYAYIIVFFILWLVFTKKKIPETGRIKIDLILISIVVFGAIVQLSSVWFMGMQTQNGIFFCCRGVPDAIYHLSLTNNLIKSVPPQEPGMEGTIVHNYHYLSNLVTADLVRVFRLPLIPTQFQYMNVILEFLIASSIASFSEILNLKKIYAQILAVLFYFSGSILFLLSYMRGLGLNFNLEILDDASKLLAGPPRAFSVAIILSGLPLFILWIKTKKNYPGVLTAIIFGALIGFKVYTGFLALCGLFFLLIYFVYRKQINMITPIFLTFAIMAALYLPVNKINGTLRFNGFWRLENFMLTSGLGISKLEYLRLNFLGQKNYLIVLIFEILFFLTYSIFQFGTQTVSFFQTKKSLSKFPAELNIFLISGLLFSLIAGLFFIQTPGGANTIQFVITFFIISSFYTALAFDYWLEKFSLPLSTFFISVFVILTGVFSVHEAIFNLIYFKTNQGVIVNKQEEIAISKIKNENNNGLFLFSPESLNDEEILYLNFLAGKSIYLGGIGLLKDHGVNIEDRLEVENEIFNSNNSNNVKAILARNNIKYMYITNSQAIPAGNFEVVYKSNTIQILKVN